MSEAMLTFTLPDGRNVTLPVAQAFALAALITENPGSSWHENDCGCCVSVHPEGDLSRGWVVGPDGESDYHEGLA